MLLIITDLLWLMKTVLKHKPPALHLNSLVVVGEKCLLIGEKSVSQ